MGKVKLLDPSDSRRRLDRYELIGEIASGGMATVFLARLAGVGGFQRFVAIKRLHPHLADEEEFVEMFLDEARLAAGIHHPHVVPILEVGTSESGFYLVMEYIEGDTLARVVARGLSSGAAVPRAILLRIVLDALAGLHAAHEVTDAHGQLVDLVHRDCSPQNILVGVDGCSRITDFGVARASTRLSQTRADRLKGKLAYMSPEQARSEGDLDRRSDLFAMGIVLWEVLAGKRLFKAATEAATLARVLMDPIPRLATVSPEVPKVFDELCHRALARDPNDRFATASELADAIEQAARKAEGASGGLGVASAREVASYLSNALGQDIAAQRESVRAWLSHGHSEPSVNERIPSSKPLYDRTIKLHLDAPPESGRTPTGPRGASRSAPPSNRGAGGPPSNRGGAGPHSQRGGPPPLSDLMVDSGPPDTLLGIGAHGARVELRESVVPSSGKTMVGVGPERTNPITLRGPGRTSPFSVRKGHDVPDLDADDGETELMERSPSSAPASLRRSGDETTPVSRAPDAVRGPRKSPAARYLVALIGLLVVAGFFAVSYRFVIVPTAPTATPLGPAAATAAPRATETAPQPQAARSAAPAEEAVEPPTPAESTRPAARFPRGAPRVPGPLRLPVKPAPSAGAPAPAPAPEDNSNPYR